MTVTERDAFAALRLDWVRSPDDVWRASPFHVDGINAGAARMIKDAIDQATDDMANPMGLVIQGQAGAGKTHLLGWVREQVDEALRRMNRSSEGVTVAPEEDQKTLTRAEREAAVRIGVQYKHLLRIEDA